MTPVAYFGIKYDSDHRNRAEILSICSRIEETGVGTACVVRDLEHWGDVVLTAQELMRATFEIIDEADIVVVEMSEKGVGLGIEAGYASAKDKPIIVLTKNEPELSTTLRGIADVIVSYDTVMDLDSLVLREAFSKCGILTDSR